MRVSRSRRADDRRLDSSERDLVARSRHPDLRASDGPQLDELLRLLRERRDRARDVARRQRREMRGKAAPSGTSAARDDTGTREKAATLAAAVKRVSKEAERRRGGEARSSLVANARRALAMKRAAGNPAAGRPGSRAANEGMRPRPNEKQAPSGALNQEGQEVAMRRGGGPR